MGEAQKPDCSRCQREPEFKEIWGCDGETATFPIRYEIGGVEHETRRCPIALLKGTNIHEVLDAYSWMKEFNATPFGLSREELPSTFVEAVAFIRTLVDKHERKQTAGNTDG